MLKQSRPGIKTLFSWLQDKLEKKYQRSSIPRVTLSNSLTCDLIIDDFYPVQYYWKNNAFKIFSSSTDINFFHNFHQFPCWNTDFRDLLFRHKAESKTYPAATIW